MAEKANILEGLHVLLVTEDDVRAAALTRSLRDLKAIVGDVKAGAKDPLALRGADLLVIDARSASATKARVMELRSDVRARWASRVELDYETLVRDDGAILLKPLEDALAPLVVADRDLTEQARRQEKLALKLTPLGPSRVLRALAAAGPTMQVEFTHETLTAEVTLSNELLVCAFAERAGERWEAWAALVRILGLPDATVSVSRRSHPAAMNIMEPIDQALEVAAQERQSSAALIAVEERSAQARAEELSDSMEIAVAPEKAGAFKRSAAGGKPRLDRTLMGVTPGLPAAMPPPARPVALKAPEVSRYVVSDNAAERIKAGRTLMGISPGALPALGGSAGKSRGETAPKLAPPPAPIPEPAESKASPFQDTSTAPNLGLPPELLNENPTVKVQAITDAAEVMAQRRPANDVSARTTISLDTDDLTDDDSNEQTLIADSAQLRELAKQSGAGDELDALLDTPDDTLPPPAAPPRELGAVDAGAKTQLLMAVIDEAVEASPLSNPPGAKPVTQFGAPADPEDTILIARMTTPMRRSRVAFLGALFVLAIMEAIVVVYVDRWQRTPHEAHEVARINSVHVVAAPGGKALKPAQSTAPSAAAAVQPANNEINAAKPADELSAGNGPAAPNADVPLAEAQQPAPQPALPSAPDVKVQAPIEPAPAEVKPVAGPAAGPAALEPSAAVEPSVAPVMQAPKPSPGLQEGPSSKQPAASTAAVPEDLDALIKAGLRALANRNVAEALPLFERAVALDARNPHAQGGLADALLGLGRLPEAKAAVDTAIKLRPRRAHYRVTDGDILKAMGDAEGSKAAWEKALEIDPEDREALARLRQ